MAVGPPAGATGQRDLIVSFCESIATTSFLSSKLTYTVPLPSATPNSGCPPRSMVPADVPFFASINVELLGSPFKVLKGWTAIAKFLGTNPASAQDWVKQGMPVKREGRFTIADSAEVQ